MRVEAQMTLLPVPFIPRCANQPNERVNCLAAATHRAYWGHVLLHPFLEHSNMGQLLAPLGFLPSVAWLDAKSFVFRPMGHPGMVRRKASSPLLYHPQSVALSDHGCCEDDGGDGDSQCLHYLILLWGSWGVVPRDALGIVLHGSNSPSDAEVFGTDLGGTTPFPIIQLQNRNT